MAFERLADRGKGCVLALVREGLFDCYEEVIGQDAQEDVGIGSMRQLMEYGPLRKRAFHGPIRIFGSCQHIVYPPRLLGGEILVVGFQEVRSVKSHGFVELFGQEFSVEVLGGSIIGNAVVPGNSRITLFEAAYPFPDLLGFDQPAL